MDLISRQAAIDAVEESRCLNHHQDGREACAHEYEHRHFLKILRELPSTNQWIPVSDGLPDEFDVICCDNRGNMLIAHPFECGDSDTGYSAESDECYMYNVVAWMPLPEPYKGGEK